MMHLKVSTARLIALFVLVCTQTAFAQSAAELVAEDTGVFIEIHDLATLRKQWHADPLGKFLEKQVGIESPVAAQAWKDIQRALNMTGPQVFDTYFGKQAIIVAEQPGGNSPMVLLSRIDDAAGRNAVRQLSLESVGKAGMFSTYRSPDHQSLFAFSNGWLAISAAGHDAYFIQVLANFGQGKTLAAEPEYGKWVSRLPTDRLATIYAYNRREPGKHFFSLSKKDWGLAVQYFGTSAGWKQTLTKQGNATQFDFGPLCDWVFGAVSLNINSDQPGSTQAIDAIIAPRKLKSDILPKLSAPLVAFVGAVPREQLVPDPGSDMPVVGLAFKMSDLSVKADLDWTLSKLITVANMMAMTWETQPMVIEERIHADQSYFVTDSGKLLTDRLQANQLQTVNLTYGAIDQWYVICTHETFFQRCIEQRSSAIPAIAPQKDTDKPMMRMHLQSSDLSAHAGSWLELLKATQFITIDPMINSDIEKLMDVFAYFDTISIRMYRTDDDYVDGRTDLKWKTDSSTDID